MLANRAALLTYNAMDQCCFTAGHALPPLLNAAQPVFDLMGRGRFLRSHINHDPGSHNFELDNRQQLYRFLGDVFYDGSDFDWREIPSEEEVKSADALRVGLPDGNADFNSIALGLMKKLPRPFKSEPRKQLLKLINSKEYVALAKYIGGERAAKHYQFRIGSEWTVPGTVFTPEAPAATTLLIADVGRKAQAKRVDGLLVKGRRVVAFDPFFFGESKIQSRDFLHVILMHAVGERALGVQAGQIAAVAEWAAERFRQPVELESVGRRLSVAARLAAVQTGTISGLKLHNSMRSLKEVINENKGANQMPEMMCFGLLESFDLPQIEALIAPRPVTIKKK